MEKQIIFGILGLVVGYIILRYLFRHRKPAGDIYNEIITNEKYKVKGQWDK